MRMFMIHTSRVNILRMINSRVRHVARYRPWAGMLLRRSDKWTGG
jgi:hypothetical protein